MMGKAAVIQAPAKLDTTAIENDIGTIQVRLEVLEQFLDMHSEKADDAKTAGFYDLVSCDLSNLRENLSDVSEAVQMLKCSPTSVLPKGAKAKA